MSYRRTPSFQLTPITGIIGVCVMIALVTFIVPQIRGFLAMTPAFLAERPWTIVSSIFTHGGWWHLFLNMFMLFFFGTYLTQFVGERKMLFVFLAGALLGNVFFLLVALFTPLGTPFSSVVGASGGVFALGGALAVLTPRTRVLLFYFIPMPLWAAIIVMFALSFSSSIAWEAHLGGLVLGAVAGYYFKSQLRKKYWW
jgi:membrane associated rhomboid family serine protease